MERNVRPGARGSGWMTVAQKDGCGPKGEVRMKAAGGVRSMEDLEQFIREGCARVGTSSAVSLLKKQEAGEQGK